MILTIDIGNSNIVLGGVEDETIVFEALEKTNLSPVLPPLYLETKLEAAPARVQVTEPVVLSAALTCA